MAEWRALLVLLIATAVARACSGATSTAGFRQTHFRNYLSLPSCHVGPRQPVFPLLVPEATAQLWPPQHSSNGGGPNHKKTRHVLVLQSLYASAHWSPWLLCRCCSRQQQERSRQCTITPAAAESVGVAKGDSSYRRHARRHSEPRQGRQ